MINLAVLLAMVWNFIVRKIVKGNIKKIIRLHAHGSGRTLVDNVVMYYDEKEKIRKHSFVVNLVFSWRPIYHDGHDGSYKKVSVVVMASRELKIDNPNTDIMLLVELIYRACDDMINKMVTI